MSRDPQSNKRLHPDQLYRQETRRQSVGASALPKKFSSIPLSLEDLRRSRGFGTTPFVANHHVASKDGWHPRLVLSASGKLVEHKLKLPGGGQLGRMLTHPASLLGIPLLILDSGPFTPAKQTLLPPQPHTHLDGPFTSESHIRELAAACDILTVEIEHVNADVLETVEKEGLCEVQPSPQTIRLIQDKYLQKRYLAEKGISVAPFAVLPEKPSDGDLGELAGKLGLPMMLKARTLAYDGRGNAPLHSVESKDIEAALEHLGDRPLYAEGWAPFVKEVAVMVVRNKQGEVRSYDAVETIHRDSILRVCLVPLRASGKGMEAVNGRAREMAEEAVATLDGAGIFGAEMFLMANGKFTSLLRGEILILCLCRVIVT